MTDRLKERLRNRLEREASRRNSAHDHFGMDNTPQSVDPDVFEALDRITQLEAALGKTTHALGRLDELRIDCSHDELGAIAGYQIEIFVAIYRNALSEGLAALHQGDRKP